ncbi:MAG: hypothetical protein AB7V16_01130 [Vulcanibacillus sp.]
MYQSRIDFYEGMVESEQEWLVSLQQSNGALAFTEVENGTISIVPYFSSITAIALLQKSLNVEYVDEVKAYFDWHFARLNNVKSDKTGTAGTIYNCTADVVNGVVVSEYNNQGYDSVDSYAALYLMVLWNYYEQTGDAEYLIQHFSQIMAVIGAMNATIDNDGLSYYKPNGDVKYLMDNSEVYQGVLSAIKLLEQVFLPHFGKETKEYCEVEQVITHFHEINSKQALAFDTILWNDTEQRYEIGLNKEGTILNFNSWKNFYPDAVAQLFPIIFGVIDSDSTRAIKLYDTFGENFEWQSMEHYNKGYIDFYWGLTAYCGALMHDEEKVYAYLNYYKNNVSPNHDYPAYNADGAWVVLASAEMNQYYKEQMQRIDPLGLVSVK